jgi:hypothetical protein
MPCPTVRTRAVRSPRRDPTEGPTAGVGAHSRCSRSSPPQPATEFPWPLPLPRRAKLVTTVFTESHPAYPARRGDVRRLASTRISMPPTMLTKCSTKHQREESGGMSTKYVRESIHSFLKQKLNTTSSQPDSSRTYKSNNEHMPREPGHGWPRPGRRAWPPMAMKSNTP